MARSETPAQRATVERVMHEFKHGELPAAQGGKVTDRQQAIALALSEAGAHRQSPAETKARLRKAKRQERDARTAKTEVEGRRRDP